MFGKKYVLALMASILLPPSALLSQVLTITEKDEDGRYVKNGKVDEDFVNRRLSDINSKLEIKINRDEVLKLLGKSGHFALPAATQQLLDQLVETMKAEKSILTAFDRALANYDVSKMTTADLQTFNQTLNQTATTILAIFDADPVVEDYYLEEETDPYKLVVPVFAAIRRRINDIEETLVKNNVDSNTTVRMGAWIYRKAGFTPVHLPGYDRLPTGEYYVLDRWSFMPTPEQLEQLKELQQLARENRDQGLNLLNQAIKEIIPQLALELKGFVNRQFSDIIKEAESIKTDIANTSIYDDAKNIEKLFNSWMELVKDRYNYYSTLNTNSGFQLDQFLSAVNNDVTTINGKSEEIIKKLQQVLEAIKALGDAVKPKAANLLQLTEEKINQFKKQISKKISITELIEGQRLNTETLEFSEEVLRRSLSDLPPTELDLAFTGAREAGDKIVIKLEAASGNPQVNIPLETRQIVLYRVAPHLQGTVGVIFADPWRLTAIEKKFQMAPYYNLLVKGAWPWGEKYRRASVINNTLAEFSWGLHVSSPDFNKDDVPELAVGFVVTALKDYLQAGIAYNVFENKPFWFFGIRLPVPAMNFGGSGSTNVPQ